MSAHDLLMAAGVAEVCPNCGTREFDVEGRTQCRICQGWFVALEQTDKPAKCHWCELCKTLRWRSVNHAV